jgi:hypothetical protein
LEAANTQQVFTFHLSVFDHALDIQILNSKASSVALIALNIN